MYRYLCFVLEVIHVIIYIVTLGCRPNINLELSKAFLYEFLQCRMQNDSARTSIKMCYDEFRPNQSSHEMDSPLLQVNEAFQNQHSKLKESHPS
jgi:hypothetical protein